MDKPVITVQDIEKLNQDLIYLKENVETLNQQWHIDDPFIKSGVPIVGKGIVLLKRAIRKSIYWFIKPYWEQQIVFNSAVTRAVSDIYRIQMNLVGQMNEMNHQPPFALEDNGKPRIIQMVSSLNFGDAVGNDVIALKNLLRSQGVITEIFAAHIHKKIAPGTARYIGELPQLKKEDIIIYHFASECALFDTVKALPCKKVLRYHNITPPEFFRGFDDNAEKATKNGLKQVKELAEYIDYALPVSDFNKQDLERMGYRCSMEVLPIYIQFDDYAQKPNENIIKKYSDGKTNIIFVGRVAPNKKIEDVISCFAYYKKQYDPTARLFLVGSYSPEDKYYKMLVKHIDKLAIKDVVFSGHIPFDEILAYYSIADAFLCMSEHEGFCVPLVEAMYFNVPIIAYDSSAIADTLGGSGVLVKEKDVEKVGQLIDETLKRKNEVILNQKQRLESFKSNQFERDREYLHGTEGGEKCLS